MHEELEITCEAAAEALQSVQPPALLDVREQFEYDIVHLPQAILVDADTAEDIVETWERDTPIICYCHHGIRSLNAVHYLRQHGFTDVRSLNGGIDQWAQRIQPDLPRY